MTRSTNRALFGHGFIYALSRVVNMLFTAVLLPVYAHAIGDEGFGTVELIASIAGFLSVIFLQGMGGSWFLLRQDYQGDSLRSFESTIVWYLLATGAVGLALVSALGETLAPWVMPGVPFYPMGAAAVLTAAASCYGVLLERKLQAEQRSFAFAAFGLVRRVTGFGLILLFVLGFGRGAEGKVFADTCTTLLAALAALVMIRPGAPTRGSWAMLRRSTAFGLPLLPHSFAGIVTDLADRLIINAMLGLSAVGVYSMGYRLAAVAVVIATALNQSFTPIFIHLAKQANTAELEGRDQDAREARERNARAALLIVASVACIALGITALGREVLALATTREFDESWTVLAPIAAGMVALTVYFPFSHALAFEGRAVSTLPLISGAAALINVGLNLWWIPVHGIQGAAIATLCSFVFLALTSARLGQRVTPMPYPVGTWCVVLGTTALGLAGCWLADRLMDDGLVRIALKGVGAGLAALAVLRAAEMRWSALRQLMPGAPRS